MTQPAIRRYVEAIVLGLGKLSCMACLLLFSVSICAQAQTPRSSPPDESAIALTVKDQTGAVIRDAQISISRIETGIKIAGQTNPEGAFQAPGLSAGRYEVAVKSVGFKTQTEIVDIGLNETHEMILTLAINKGDDHVGTLIPMVEPIISTVDPEYLTTILDLPMSGGPTTLISLPQPPKKSANPIKRFFSSLGRKLRS